MLFKKKKNTTLTGRIGERLAIEYLCRHGYEILEKNYRKQFGEVDIIAREQGTLCFVEVKTRHSSAYGAPFEAVDWRKQRQLSKIAQDYLLQKQLLDTAARFDVVAVMLTQEHRSVKIELIKNAFDFVG
jgi:putative endonuclease